MTQEGLKVGNREFVILHVVDSASYPPTSNKSGVTNNNGWPLLWDTTSKKPDLAIYNNVLCSIIPDVYMSHTSFQKPVTLGYEFNNFPIYVNETDHFMSEFPKLETEWSRSTTVSFGAHERTQPFDMVFKGIPLRKTVVIYPDIRKAPFDYVNEKHFAALFGMFVASTLCGISKENLDDRNVSNVLKSFVRYHLYFQTRKFVENPGMLSNNKYSDYVDIVKSRIPYTFTNDGKKGLPCVNYGKQDYISMIPYRSHGIDDKEGIRLLQESIQSYVHCILGAQTVNRNRIVGDGASSEVSQDEFRRFVTDNIGAPNETNIRALMRKQIKVAQVICNFAVTPGVELAPSNMQFSKVVIPGFNDVLTKATTTMDFGANDIRGYDDSKKHIFDRPTTKAKSLVPRLRSETKPVIVRRRLRGDSETKEPEETKDSEETKDPEDDRITHYREVPTIKEKPIDGDRLREEPRKDIVEDSEDSEPEISEPEVGKLEDTNLESEASDGVEASALMTLVLVASATIAGTIGYYVI